MPKRFTVIKRVLLLAGVLAPCSSLCLAEGIQASATYTSTQVSPGLYDYSLTLQDSGTTAISTFWFSWVPGAGFLSQTPVSVTNPAGWADTITSNGAAIRWTTTTAPIAAGGSLSGFNFESSETPSQLLLDFTGTGTGAGDPVTTSFVYIGAPLADPGFQLTATPATTAVTPEPGTILLTLSGAILLSFWGRKRATHLSV